MAVAAYTKAQVTLVEHEQEEPLAIDEGHLRLRVGLYRHGHLPTRWSS